ncbi:MAG: hypothetical protein FJ096_02515 [Deltaproteobacteria bacterium]|nr:hypothetical protein [Deltaproteobacteria bacterium]
MRQSIDLPAVFVHVARKHYAAKPMVLAVDPGRKCGVAVLDTERGRCFSSTSLLVDVTTCIADLLDEAHAHSAFAPRVVHAFAREAPYSTSNAALAAGRANAGALWSLGYAAGWVDAAATRWIRSAAKWDPQPVTWRSVIGLNSGERRRDAVNERVLAWAEATTKKELRSKRGAKLYDEANAVALAYATASVFDAARRTE